MNQEKKIEKILEGAISSDLTEYLKLLKAMKKRMPFFGGTRKLAASLLKELLGDISRLDLSLEGLFNRTAPGKLVFEDVKDGRARLFINIGKNHGFSPGDLIREIVRRSGLDGKQIGKIDIHSTYSFFEIPEQYAEVVVLSFDDVKIKGISVVVEPAKKKKKS